MKFIDGNSKAHKLHWSYGVIYLWKQQLLHIIWLVDDAKELWLNGLTSRTDSQAESLSQVGILIIEGLTSISDTQAESFSKTPALFLGGLTSITDLQAKSLSRVEQLKVSEALQPLIDKYKNQ